ncbi:YbaL family putative K(+) efflux transporter [Sphingoaurantiacus capsulatus]|uniref:YbaL family putative K(+) efflux transporter n=1 Tax=Sphingoaurantiacus capsulatus TaxID=1771310 RepID=A0ABV7XAC5_9SPHN
MTHHTPLIATIVAGLVVAFLMGALAQRLRVSPLAGYLLAGVLVGPFTPGYVVDARLAGELAELGVILLMFGVGLHFSLRDLMAVKNIAVPGAVVQIGVATLLGLGLSQMLGWSIPGGIVFGLALSVASTVVLLRALESRNLIETERGRIAVGWLIVEDLAMVLALVMLPALAGRGGDVGLALGLTALKVAGFIAFMLIVGRRVIPWVLHWVAHTGSRELFRLAVLAIALGVAFGAAALFDVSFALGAFFAGMILGETRLSKRAAEETLPLRDAFAVLFFVSVGMLFNPAVVTEQPWALLATVLIIVIGKSVAAYAIVRAFGHKDGTAFTVSASLAQIGEFSFILAGLGVTLGVLPAEGRDLILAGAIISILLHPFIFGAVENRRAERKRLEQAAADAIVAAAAAEPEEECPDCHVVLIGYGRVGHLLGEGLAKAGQRFVVIEDQKDIVEAARGLASEVIVGNAADAAVLKRAGLANASRLLLAIPEGFEAGQIAEKARAINPALVIIARAHSDEEVDYLGRHGAHHVVMGEREIAARMLGLATA